MNGTPHAQATLERLHRAAQREGLLPADEPAPEDGVPTERSASAIETLLELALPRHEPDDAECRRHFEAHAAEFGAGERVRARHVLFAVTPGVDVNALRRRAEACLVELRCADASGPAFAEAAAALSNCPSGAQGGDLGWLRRDDCAPEFARELFAKVELGVLPRLVTSRHGLHVVEVLERDAGPELRYESVRPAVRQALQRQAWATAVRRWVQALDDNERRDG